MEIRATLTEKRRPPESVVEHIGEGDDLDRRVGNREPVTVLDAIRRSRSGPPAKGSIKNSRFSSGVFRSTEGGDAAIIEEIH
jgi:hypothetical protein